MKLKLYRDNVVSMTNGGDLVGVYTSPQGDKTHFDIEPDGTLLLAEMPPEKADKIIKLWNER